MQLGKTLVGAIIGAALGIGLMVAANRLFQLDDVWLAIPVAILTGLGVRLMVATSGHASYLRGAITGILALAAYLGGVGVQRMVAQTRAEAPRPPVAAQTTEAAEGEAADEAADPAEAAPPAPVQQAPPVRDVRGVPRAGAQAQNPLDFVWLGIAALIAYELGRGTGPSTKPVVTAESSEPSQPVPAGTHPDA
jgi:hypothetical protein